MFENSDFVVAHRAQTKLILIECISVLFGVNEERLTPELMDAVFLAISDRFIGIRMHDIKECFRSAEIEKKQYVSISRDEVLAPIRDYWIKKQFIISKTRYLDEKQNEESERISKEDQFKAEAIDVFNLSKHNKKWSGTPFQAFVIAPTIANEILPEIKKVLWKEAQTEFNQNRLNPLYDPSNPLNENRIYSQKIMLHYCQNIEI